MNRRLQVNVSVSFLLADSSTSTDRASLALPSCPLCVIPLMIDKAKYLGHSAKLVAMPRKKCCVSPSNFFFARHEIPRRYVFM